MTLEEFHIGREFIASGKRYRVTDVGTRAVLAIQVDSVAITTKHPDGTMTNRALSKVEAMQQYLFIGPPYRVVEHPFDEDDQEICIPVSTWMFFPEER